MTTAALVPEDTVAHERRITVALFAAGLTTFASMYSAQALLPSLSAAFGATPARAALAVSLTTGLLAVAIVPMSVLSDRLGRTRVMIGSAVAASVIGLLLPFSPNLDALLIGRAVQGVVLAGVPAVAMGYLAEEIGSAGLASAMGVYIAGTSLGGLTGRLIPAFTLEVGPWRWALATIAIAAAVCAGIFVRMLPPSRRFTPRPLAIRSVAAGFAGHLRDRTLLPLYGLAFVMMGGFVSMYNFLGYRLTREPFGLSAATVGLVFVLYLAGTATAAAAGRMTARLGRSRVMGLGLLGMGIGLGLTLPDVLPVILFGVLLCTAGFFAIHSVASGWVGAAADGNRAAASALYMCAYYLGSSIAGGLGGLAFGSFGWAGLAVYVAVLVAVAAGLVGALTARSRAVQTIR
ncbi:MFS transporter [Nocardia sp. NBC_01503]|uniref:MFS transporter n=1 Tax=Nocardia sp. NBC_01503 TaxID=2975997 RepID=UPI002E7BAF55|nr:MFS transporter [Nocardia sp. NBC_01503]WTL29386.1 MFS transporter [Nocardia sp. NBC_01503]